MFSVNIVGNDLDVTLLYFNNLQKIDLNSAH